MVAVAVHVELPGLLMNATRGKVRAFIAPAGGVPASPYALLMRCSDDACSPRAGCPHDH
jgi:hypothetical protein